MRGIPDSEPTGVAADCFYVLGMHKYATTSGLRDLIAYEDGGSGPGLEEVKTALRILADQRERPLIERTDAPRKGVEPTWRISAHGYDKLRDWCGDDEDSPPRQAVRVSCGLGWPPDSRGMYGPANGFYAANANRTRKAADRDVEIAEAALRLASPDWPPRYLTVATARAQMRSASWQEVGASVGMTKDTAAAIFSRLRKRVMAAEKIK